MNNPKRAIRPLLLVGLTLAVVTLLGLGLQGGGALPIRAASNTGCVAPGSAGAPMTLANPQANAVEYNRNKNRITLREGAQVSIGSLARALNQPTLLRELAPGEWLLTANIEVERGATLRIAAPEVRWLKLRSDKSGFVSLKVRGGKIELSATCVTSWDTQANSFDHNYKDGRSFVLAREQGQLFIRGAQLSYLGYAADESYGVAFRQRGTGGEVSDSVLGYNYYGLYLHEVSDLQIRGNEVHHSVLYGIDPHTKSSRLTIENNRAHHNGKHGIILAEGCRESIIRNNQVFNNTLHGIVLYAGSNNNTVEGNSVYGNAQEGINLNNASDNVVRNNTVRDNGKAGIGVGQGSRRNLVEQNQVHANREDGIALYSKARDNTIQGNVVRGNAGYGINLKSDDNSLGSGNEVAENRAGDVQGN